MKYIIAVSCLIMTACCNSKQVVSASPEPVSNAAKAYVVVPSCIQKLINQYSEEEKQNPPRKIYSYSYLGKQVYYVPAICCDFYSDLLDTECNVLGHPDGGITGKGDGKFPDFNADKKDEVLVWEDKR